MRIDAHERMSRREYIEEEYHWQSAVIEQLGAVPTPTEPGERQRLGEARRTAADRRDQAFCELRNHTNPKYGGDPEWTGDTCARVEHAVSGIR